MFLEVTINAVLPGVQSPLQYGGNQTCLGAKLRVQRWFGHPGFGRDAVNADYADSVVVNNRVATSMMRSPDAEYSMPINLQVCKGTCIVVVLIN